MISCRADLWGVQSFVDELLEKSTGMIEYSADQTTKSTANEKGSSMRCAFEMWA